MKEDIHADCRNVTCDHHPSRKEGVHSDDGTGTFESESTSTTPIAGSMGLMVPSESEGLETTTSETSVEDYSWLDDGTFPLDASELESLIQKWCDSDCAVEEEKQQQQQRNWSTATITTTISREDLWTRLLDTTSSNTSCSVAFGRITSDAVLVHHLKGIWTRTLSTLYVCCGSMLSIEPTTKDDATTTNKCVPLSTFLEAAVSLCGRRGERYLLEAVHHHAQASKDFDSELPQHRMADLVYRLCLACQRLLRSGDNVNNYNDDWVDVDAAPPVSWNAFFGSGMSVTSGNANASISFEEWNDWVQKHAPGLARSLSTVFVHLLLENSTSRSIDSSSERGGLPSGKELLFRLPFLWTDHLATTSAAQRGCLRHFPWNNNGHGIRSGSTVPLQLALMGLGGPWRPVYQSNHDGLSMHTLVQALTTKQYGPTVMMIETTERGELFGYYSSVPWKNSKYWSSMNSVNDSNNEETEDNESFLFRFHPSWSVYRSAPMSSIATSDSIPNCPTEVPVPPWSKSTRIPTFQQYLYLPNSRQPKNSHGLIGLAVGGTSISHPRLHLNAEFERCHARCHDTVFHAGPLLTDPPSCHSDNNCHDDCFDVFNLEVWAFPIDHQIGHGPRSNAYNNSVEAAQRATDDHERLRRRCAKVDRTQFLDDFKSGLFSNTLFQHRLQSRGRADFRVGDDGDGYFVDGKEPSTKK